MLFIYFPDLYILVWMPMCCNCSEKPATKLASQTANIPLQFNLKNTHSLTFLWVIFMIPEPSKIHYWYIYLNTYNNFWCLTNPDIWPCTNLWAQWSGKRLEIWRPLWTAVTKSSYVPLYTLRLLGGDDLPVVNQHLTMTFYWWSKVKCGWKGRKGAPVVWNQCLTSTLYWWSRVKCGWKGWPYMLCWK